MIKILRVPNGSEEHAQARRLREEVLLGPLGLTLADFDREFPGFEGRLEHYVAVDVLPASSRVLGCACLLVDDPERGQGRLMQLVVDPQRQREGLGRRLVVAMESRAFGELNLSELVCHSTMEAAGFYRSLGWAEDPVSFFEAGLEHRKMSMRAPAPHSDGDAV